MRERSDDNRKRCQAFISDLTLLQQRAVALDMPITARALHDAVRASGWELAGETAVAAKFASDIP